MKEMLNQHIDTRTIEDRELRWLVKYEQIIAWSKAGGFQKAAAAYRAQIAEAERKKAVAELRVAQINVITTTVAAYDGKAVRNAQIAQVAAQHRADAAERQAIQEACDEVLALIPEDDMDDILSEVSKALGIELPTAEDKADICQRSFKSMEQLKKELGPSLATFISNPTASAQSAVADHHQAQELIADVRRKSMLQGMVDDTTSEKYFEAGIARYAAEEKLTTFISHLIKQVHFPLTSAVEWVAPKRGDITPVQRIDEVAKFSDWAQDWAQVTFEGTMEWIRQNKDEPDPADIEPIEETPPKRPASFESRAAAEEWLLDNVYVFESKHFDWLDRYYPEDALDEETLDLGCKAAANQFDAGKTLEELGWKRPEKVVADDPAPNTGRTNLEAIHINVMRLLDRRFSDDFDITLRSYDDAYKHITAVHDKDQFAFTILIGEGDELKRALQQEISGSAKEIYVIHSESDRIEKYAKHVSVWDGIIIQHINKISSIEIETESFGHILEHQEIYSDVGFEEVVT
jgi:hypothetical protein